MLKKLSFLKLWIKKEKVIDLILFGSSVRDKSHPKDLDLCILINDQDENKSFDLIESLAQHTKKIPQKVQINILKTSDFWNGNTLTKTLLQEGISIRYATPLASRFGFESQSIFLYSLKHFTPSQRVRFHYMLNGRYGTKGMLHILQAQLWNPGTISLPIYHEDRLKEIFALWKVKYNLKRILIG